MVKETIRIDDRKIGEDEPVYIIAEAGVNHNGKLELGKQLVDEAKKAGADAVKFQTFSTERITLRNAKKAKYQIDENGKGETQYKMLKKLELSKENHHILKDYCEKKGITFLSTPYDNKSVDLLDNIGVEAFKLASGDLTNNFLLEYVASKGKPVILSTGMAFLSEVARALSKLKENGLEKIILLHCLSNYPATFENVNLLCIRTLREEFDKIVGFSDHTKGIGAAPFAIPLGAKVLEKHFTIDKTLEGPDHKASLSPNELKKCVEQIRKIEKSLGNGVKTPALEEMDSRETLRKSLVTKKAFKKGEKIRKSKLTSKRPGSGISPQYIDHIIGKKVKRDIDENEILKIDDIKGY